MGINEEDIRIVEEKSTIRRRILKGRIAKLTDAIWNEDGTKFDIQNLDDPKKLKKLVESTDDIHIDIRNNVTQEIYKKIIDEYNYEHSRAKKRGTKPSKTRIGIRNISADVEVLKENITASQNLKIEGDAEFPSDIWKTSTGKEIDFEESIKASISASIPSECGKKLKISDGNFTPLNKENIGGLCISDHSLFTINKLFSTFFEKINNIGEKTENEENVKSIYYNYDMLVKILLDTEENYKDMVRNIIAPDCTEKQNQIDMAKIESLSCKKEQMNKIKFKDLKDFIDTLTEEEVNSYWKHHGATDRVGTQPGNTLEDHKRFLKNEIKPNYIATNYFTGRLSSTKKGRNFFAEKIAKRLNRRIEENIRSQKKEGR